MGAGQPPQTSSQHRAAEHSAKRRQPLQSSIADQHKRATATLAVKARSAVEQNLERLHPHFRRRRACCPDVLLRQTAEKEQRNMQALRFDRPAIELRSALENAS